MKKIRSLKQLYMLIFWVLFLTLIGVPGSGLAMKADPSLQGIDAGGQLQIVGTKLNVPWVSIAAAGLVQPASTRMNEGFEGAWPANGWQVIDNNTADGGEYLLGKRTCHPRTGNSAGWMIGGGANGTTLGCASNYPNNVETWAFYGPIDLSQATAASLRFYVWGRTPAPQNNACLDGVFVGSFTNDTDLTGGALCGDATGGNAGNGYYQIDYPLNDRLGASQVWLALVFFSDGSVTNIGFTLDDLSLDVTSTTPPSPPATSKKVYLPFVAKPQKIETPPSGTAFEWIKRTLETAGAQENFVLDTSRCTFNSASGWLYLNGVTADYPRSQVESKVSGNLKIMTFRASTRAMLADYKRSYLVSPLEISYPTADQVRLHGKLEPDSTNLLNFTGNVIQNEMQIDYREDASQVFSPGDVVQYGSEHLEAILRCPIVWLPPSEWTPLRVSNVKAFDMYLYGSPPSRCLKVSWTPAPTGLPAAEVSKYELTLVGSKGDVLGVVEAPNNVSEYLDCSEPAQRVNMCNNPSVSYDVVAVSTTGKKGIAPIPVLPAQIWRPCGFLP